MRQRLLLINLFLVITFFLNMVFNFILNTKDYEFLNLQITLGELNLLFGTAIIGIALLYGFILYVHVSYLMWKLHHYEFKKGQCSRILFFLVIICFTALHVDQITGDMLNGFTKGSSLYMLDKKKRPS